MELILPRKLNACSSVKVNNTNVLLVIGTNGSGKTLFGRDLADRYPQQSVRIAALKALSINRPPLNLQDILSDRLFLPRDPVSIPLLSEYEKLIIRLQQEEFEAAVVYKEAAKQTPGMAPPVTKIDQIQHIWEKMFPHNRLVRKSGFFELASTSKNGNSYNAARMSDGEKIVFYLIGAVLSARPQALLLVEEPEIHLHHSIKNYLWDELEAARPDCVFVYFTHDIEFASSRRESQRIWIRSYDADDAVWDYELIQNNETFPEEVYMELLGSRKPILFIEGTESSSIDNRLYPQIFPDYLVKPMGGCQKVIETTKAFGELKAFHMLESKGIVDRDRRTEGEIAYLREQNILVPDVAEVENLLMLEQVIKTVARRLMRDGDEIFGIVRENVVRLFEKELDNQVILHAKHQVRRKLETTTDRKITTVDQLSEHVEMIREHIHVHAICEGIKTVFLSYVRQADYQSILRVYNQKGMLPQSRLCNLLGINNKESYLNLVISILKENKEDARLIRQTIKEALGAL